MIDPKDVSYGCWINNSVGLAVQVFTIEPKMEAEGLNILINGEDPGKFYGIPLSPELMIRIGWQRTQEHSRKIVFYPPGAKKLEDPVIFNLTSHFKPYTMVFCLRPIAFLHELQQRYRWETGKHMEVTMPLASLASRS